MRHRMVAAAAALALAVTPLALQLAPGANAAVVSEEDVAAATHTLVVEGAGVSMYPQFSPGTARYGIRTTEDTPGSVTVRATTSDPTGEVLVNGRPASGPETVVTGLRPGDEVSVIFADAAGRSSHSLVYLPPKFPHLRASGDGPVDDLVALTLRKWRHAPPTFEVLVDRNAVPVMFRESRLRSWDLKRQPNGRLSVVRDRKKGLPQLVELDDAYRVVDSHRAARMNRGVNGHDGILLPNGHQVLLGYEPANGRVDGVIQEQDENGKVVFRWDSSELRRETLLPDDKDYAHINSVQVTRDGHFLASFRHLSSVVKIARFNDGRHRKGDVIWRLGGRKSDFEFRNDPFESGPCAQHTAFEQPNGNIVIYDNGSRSFRPMCVDAKHPRREPVAREVTRVTEYDVNPRTGVARLVWSWNSQRFAHYGGSSQRLSNGNTVVGWSVGRQSLVDEVAPNGNVIWTLWDQSARDGAKFFFSTYRAQQLRLPDLVDPEVQVAEPDEGATYPLGSTVLADYECTDAGGSDLATCTGDVPSGEALDTSTEGEHTFTVTATDGAGNTTAVTRSYEVTAP